MESTYIMEDGTTITRISECEDVKAMMEQTESSVQNKPVVDNPYQIGKQFEDYVLNLFPEAHFSIIHKTVGAADLHGRKTEDCIYPDYKFRDKSSSIPFWVECKYRSSRVNDGSVVWTDRDHLERYQNIQKESKTKVYVILGLGGKPDNPDSLYLFDTECIRYPKLYPSTLRKCQIQKHPIKNLNEMNAHIRDITSHRRLPECQQTASRRLTQTVLRSSQSLNIGAR